jgi:hypothetical protein
MECCLGWRRRSLHYCRSAASKRRRRADGLPTLPLTGDPDDPFAEVDQVAEAAIAFRWTSRATLTVSTGRKCAPSTGSDRRIRKE